MTEKNTERCTVSPMLIKGIVRHNNHNHNTYSMAYNQACTMYSCILFTVRCTRTVYLPMQIHLVIFFV